MVVNNIKAAFEAANLLAADATERSRGQAVRLDDAAPRPAGDELHNLDPWFIAKCQPRSHRAARASLQRAGFEAWYPVGRVLKAMPRRMLSPSKRKKKQVVLREDVRTPYGDYIFLRRLFGSFSLMRLFDLNGMAGLCLFGETPATIPDYRIEMLRLSEFDGCYDRCEAKISGRQLQLAEIVSTEAAKERWKDQRATIKVLDGTKRTIHFIEEFGRITRVVAGQGDQQLPALSPAEILPGSRCWRSFKE
jgi:hypothetical protein